MKRKKTLLQLLLIIFSATLFAQIPEKFQGTWDWETTSDYRGWMKYTQDSIFLQFENQNVITVDTIWYESDTLIIEFYNDTLGLDIGVRYTLTNDSTIYGKDNYGFKTTQIKRRE